MPPNWWDLVNEPFPVSKPGPPLVPIPLTPVEMPPGEKFFDVSPPQVTSPSVPFEIFLTPIPSVEVPYEFPGEFPLPDSLDLGPGPAPTPTSTPRVDPVPIDPLLDPFFEPRIAPQPVPTGAPAPDVFGNPFADPIGDPIGTPFPTPDVPAGPRERPGTPTVPDSFASPLPDVVDSPFADPLLTEFGPNPVPPERDTCQCDKKKPKKKKSAPRAVCYRGTYKQNTRGITFTPKEEVPCESKQRAKSSTKKSGRTPTWQDTLNDVFYPQP